MISIIPLIGLFIIIYLSASTRALQDDQLLTNDQNPKTPCRIQLQNEYVLWTFSEYNATPHHTRYQFSKIHPQALGDLNDDGVLDIVFFRDWLHDSYIPISLYAVDGATGEVLWTQDHHISQEFPDGWFSPVVIDYDGDGTLEVFYSEQGGWLNICEGETGEISRRAFVGSIGTMPKFLEIDGDGILDIIIGSISYSPNPNLICLSGRTLQPIWSFSANYSIALSPAIADINGDGDLEIVIRPGGGGGWGGIPWPWPDWKFKQGNRVYALRASDGQIVWGTDIPDYYNSYNPPLISDLDSDGHVEIIIMGERGNPNPIVIILDGTDGKIRDRVFVGGGDEYPHTQTNALIGDWNGDGSDELIFPCSIYSSGTRNYIFYIGIYDGQDIRMIEVGKAKYSDYLRRNNFLLDIDGDGIVEYISGDYYSYSSSISSNQTTLQLYLPDIILLASDLNGDGLTELLVNRKGNLTLLSSNEPTVQVTINGLHGEGTAYPESLLYNISALLSFPGSGHMLDEITLVLGNGTDGISIKFTDDGFEGILVDGLDGSIEVFEGCIRNRDGANEYILSMVISFTWDYPIVGDSWISVHVRHGGMFDSSFVDICRYRVEMGIVVLGVPVLSDTHGEELPSGNWTSKGAIVNLTGLRVVHIGSEDLLVPRIFGIKLSRSDAVISSVPRGIMDANIVLTFPAPAVSNGLETFTLELALDDVIHGASIGPPVTFELRVDSEPPFKMDQWPQDTIITNKPSYILTLNMSDGNGSGIDTDNVRLKVFNENDNNNIWYDAFVAERYMDGLRFIAAITLWEDDDYHVQLSVTDMVGNEKIVELTIRLDTIPTDIWMIEREKWFNTTRVDIAYGIDGYYSLHQGLKTIEVITITGEEVNCTIRSGTQYIYIWNVTIDFEVPGRYWITTSIRDEAGNVATHSSQINVDTLPPIITPFIPSLLNATNGIIEFIVRIDDGNGSGFGDGCLEYRLEDEWIPYTGSRITSPIDIVVKIELGEDTDIEFRVKDRAGNFGTSGPHTLYLNEPPLPKVTSPLGGSWHQKDKAIVLDGSSSEDPDGQGLAFLWELDGHEIGNGHPVEELFITPGDHSLVLVVSDGYHEVASDQIWFTVNDRGPSPSSSFTIIWIIVLFAFLAVVGVALAFMRLKSS